MPRVILQHMENVAQTKLGETWDRLTLLLIAEPRKGWEQEFEEITRREIERLNPLPVTEPCGE